MVTITAEYQGELHCTLRHGPSQATLETDAPVDNHGRGASFSPTDLVAAALASCAMTVMGILAQKERIPLPRMSAVVEKVMEASPRRRIRALRLRIEIPGRLTAAQKGLLEHAAETCPVASSLREDLEAEMTFVYPDEARVAVSS
jgi:putative redox protein